MNTSDYDYPMSWSCWRGICQNNGWEVPPPDRPELPSFQEYKQQFINWQDIERAKYFGYYSSEKKPTEKPREYYKPLPPLATLTPPKPIIRKPKGRGVEL